MKKYLYISILICTSIHLSHFKLIKRQIPSNDFDDGFIFEDEFQSRFNIPRTTTKKPETSTFAIPGTGTRRTPCEDRCLTTHEYNPVCGDNFLTYFNHHRLVCAQRCGKRVKMKHIGVCSRG